MEVSTDALDFTYGTRGADQDLQDANKIYADVDCVDYDIGRGDDSKFKVSFLGVKTVEQGVEWFEQHYPQYPEYLIEILAEYNWGRWRLGNQGIPPESRFQVSHEAKTVRFD